MNKGFLIVRSIILVIVLQCHFIYGQLTVEKSKFKIDSVFSARINDFNLKNKKIDVTILITFEHDLANWINYHYVIINNLKNPHDEKFYILIEDVLIFSNKNNFFESLKEERKAMHLSGYGAPVFSIRLVRN